MDLHIEELTCEGIGHASRSSQVGTWTRDVATWACVEGKEVVKGISRGESLGQQILPVKGSALNPDRSLEDPGM